MLKLKGVGIGLAVDVTRWNDYAVPVYEKSGDASQVWEPIPAPGRMQRLSSHRRNRLDYLSEPFDDDVGFWYRLRLHLRREQDRGPGWRGEAPEGFQRHPQHPSRV